MAYFLQRVENEPAVPRPGRVMVGRPPLAPCSLVNSDGPSSSSEGNANSPLSRFVQEGYIGVPTAPNQQGFKGGVRRQNPDNLEQMKAGHQQQNDPNYTEKPNNPQYKVAPGGASSLSLDWSESSSSAADPVRRARGVGGWAPSHHSVVGSGAWQSGQESSMAGCFGESPSSNQANSAVSRPAYPPPSISASKLGAAGVRASSYDASAMGQSSGSGRYRSQSPGAFGNRTASVRAQSRDAGGMASCLKGGPSPYPPSSDTVKRISFAIGSDSEVAIAGSSGRSAYRGVAGAGIGDTAYESRTVPSNYAGLGVLPGMGSAAAPSSAIGARTALNRGR